MEPSSEQKDGADSAKAPGLGLKLMIVIVTGVALVAIYANVQEGRRDKIEEVVTTPVTTATPAAASPGR